MNFVGLIDAREVLQRHREMADEEKGLSAAVEATSESEDTESGSEEEEEEESFEEYESGAEEAAGGEPAAVKTDAGQDAAQVNQPLISQSVPVIFLRKGWLTISTVL